MQKITPFLWFDTQAEEAVNYYVSIFRDAGVTRLTRYDEAASKAAGRPKGSVMTVEFKLEGQPFVALNGGPIFKFTEAVSFVVDCASQQEIDHYWDRLTEGGDKNAQQCGWLKDKFGLSWQIVPRALIELLSDPDPAKAGRVMKAMLPMKKLDLGELLRAAKG